MVVVAVDYWGWWWQSGGSAGGNSLCKGSSCNSCRNAIVKCTLYDGGGGGCGGCGGQDMSQCNHF